MRKLKKEFIFKNNLNILFLREKKLVFYKFILFQTNFIFLKKIACRYIFFNTVHNKSIICVISGRRGNINKKFYLSRIALRFLIYSGNLLGYRKSSW